MPRYAHRCAATSTRTMSWLFAMTARMLEEERARTTHPFSLTSLANPVRTSLIPSEFGKRPANPLQGACPRP